MFLSFIYRQNMYNSFFLKMVWAWHNAFFSFSILKVQIALPMQHRGQLGGSQLESMRSGCELVPAELDLWIGAGTRAWFVQQIWCHSARIWCESDKVDIWWELSRTLLGGCIKSHLLTSIYKFIHINLDIQHLNMKINHLVFYIWWE